ncbi:MAG: ribosomal RNA small subunit methyltransferase A [Deltaproteobacteria bacterium RIFOXYD12_FULL_57_12]|nr:MAG: ribosomal RNA small subunit methyltransferase A [Deltaproteobacteria bacterium RIFOXYD12_FULL_57_12]
MPKTSKVKKILATRGLAPKKKLGQNFLINRNIADRIVTLAGISAQDVILELGVGFGALTGLLAERARQVIGLEIDRGIINWQQEEGNLPANVTLLHQDIMKADFRQLADQSGGRLRIVANLPYSISNPLLFKLLDNQDLVAWAVLMLQKEVGQRLVAAIGTKEYGVLSVLLGASATVTNLMTLGAAQFHPRPKVDSVVVRIEFQPVPARVAAQPPHDRHVLKKLVNAAFQQRRKTLLNGLASLDLDRQKIIELLGIVGISPQTRAETLSPAEFVNLATVFAKHLTPINGISTFTK